MNILVVGNGFDLSHGLPTEYRDFLRFTDVFLAYLKNGGSHLSHEKSIPFAEYFDKLFFTSRAPGIIEELEYLIYSNVWIKYFKETQLEKGWIDFEKEISRIIQALDEVRSSIHRQNQLKISPSNMDLHHANLLRPFLVKEMPLVNLAAVDYYGERLLNDLDKLTRCLEIYLGDYVNTLPVTQILPDIAALSIDGLLSFNYTNTYQRIYSQYSSKKICYDFIHGKADIHHTQESCPLVLGIDEYLSEGIRDTDNHFIQFKKFYQRIYKMTGNESAKWLEQAENNRCNPWNLYIWGHSLDITDKDILKKLMTAKGTQITIFYRNRKSLGRLIANLVKIIGEDELIRRSGGAHQRILFQQEQKPMSIYDRNPSD